MRDIGVTGVQTCALPICFRLALLGGVLGRRFADLAPGQSMTVQRLRAMLRSAPNRDRKSVVQGTSVDLGGRRIIIKKRSWKPTIRAPIRRWLCRRVPSRL